MLLFESDFEFIDLHLGLFLILLWNYHFTTCIFTRVHYTHKKISFAIFTRIKINVENRLKKIFCSQKLSSGKFP